MKHWPLQKATDLFKTQWYTVSMFVHDHVCAFMPVQKFMFLCGSVCTQLPVCVTWCTARNILSHQPSLTVMHSQMSSSMVDCMIYCLRHNGVATVMNLQMLWCTGLCWRDRSKYDDGNGSDYSDDDDDETSLFTYKCKLFFWDKTRRRRRGRLKSKKRYREQFEEMEKRVAVSHCWMRQCFLWWW